MDPRANIEEQRQLAREILEDEDNDKPVSQVSAVRLADLVLALDKWREYNDFDIYPSKLS